MARKNYPRSCKPFVSEGGENEVGGSHDPVFFKELQSLEKSTT